jgi:hypothetical protein
MPRGTARLRPTPLTAATSERAASFASNYQPRLQQEQHQHQHSCHVTQQTRRTKDKGSADTRSNTWRFSSRTCLKTAAPTAEKEIARAKLGRSRHLNSTCSSTERQCKAFSEHRQRHFCTSHNDRVNWHMHTPQRKTRQARPELTT